MDIHELLPGHLGLFAQIRNLALQKLDLLVELLSEFAGEATQLPYPFPDGAHGLRQAVGAKDYQSDREDEDDLEGAYAKHLLKFSLRG